MSTSAQSIPSGLSLRANLSWTFVGNVVYAACQWGMLVVLAKLTSAAVIGQFALGMAITAPVIAFASLRTRLVLATDARHEYLFGDYLGLRLITTALALLIIVGVALVAGYEWETTLVILAVGVAKAFECISDVFYGLVQQHDRMDRIAISKMVKGPLSLVVLSVVVYLTGSVLWGALGLAATWGLILVGYDLRSGGLVLTAMSQSACRTSLQTDRGVGLRPLWEMRTLAKLAWLALPLGIVMMLSSLATNIPQYFVDQHVGTSGLGVFAALAYFDKSGNIVATAVGHSVSPLLSRYHAAENWRMFGALLLKLAGAGVVLGGMGVLIALVAGSEILALLYRPEYAKQDVFVKLMVAAGLKYVAAFLIYGVSAARYFRVQALLYAAVAGILVLSCMFLVPSGGLSGAATALIIARGVEATGGVAIVVYVLLTSCRGNGIEERRTARRGGSLHRTTSRATGLLKGCSSAYTVDTISSFIDESGSANRTANPRGADDAD